MFGAAKAHDLGIFNSLFYPLWDKAIWICPLELIVALSQSALITVAPRVQVTIFSHSSGVKVPALCIDDLFVPECF